MSDQARDAPCIQFNSSATCQGKFTGQSGFAFCNALRRGFAKCASPDRRYTHPSVGFACKTRMACSIAMSFLRCNIDAHIFWGARIASTRCASRAVQIRRSSTQSDLSGAMVSSGSCRDVVLEFQHGRIHAAPSARSLPNGSHAGAMGLTRPPHSPDRRKRRRFLGTAATTLGRHRRQACGSIQRNSQP